RRRDGGRRVRPGAQRGARRDVRPAPPQGRALPMSAEGGTRHPELKAALLAAMDERAPRVHRDPVGACYDFAAAAHGEQRRESGEPHMAHAVAVAVMLVDLLEARADTPIVCAALLHDVVEDTPVTVVDLERRFGREVAHLVE